MFVNSWAPLDIKISTFVPYKLTNDTKNSSITQQYKCTDAEVVLVQNYIFQQYLKGMVPPKISISPV